MAPRQGLVVVVVCVCAGGGGPRPPAGHAPPTVGVVAVKGPHLGHARPAGAVGQNPSCTDGHARCQGRARRWHYTSIILSHTPRFSTPFFFVTWRGVGPGCCEIDAKTTQLSHFNETRMQTTRIYHAPRLRFRGSLPLVLPKLPPAQIAAADVSSQSGARRGQASKRPSC